MSVPPTRPLLYHITHVDNLAPILQAGGLWSDARMVACGGPPTSIGMGSIKQRRLMLPVKCHPVDKVGDYVPFYFCPRSIMLYVIHCGNRPELRYSGGQEYILHLEADLLDSVAWANRQRSRWAFSLSNAGAYYAEFRGVLANLNEVDWEAVRSADFRDPRIKEGKQAEFLMHDFFPWDLVHRIGVRSNSVRQHVLHVLSGSPHQPLVEVIPDWYY